MIVICSSLTDVNIFILTYICNCFYVFWIYFYKLIEVGYQLV